MRPIPCLGENPPVTAQVRDLDRIAAALSAAGQMLSRFRDEPVVARHKRNLDPVTDADTAINRLLQESLVDIGEGWLSEETRDNKDRLTKERVWIVDPLDGTKEFVAGIPEWCVSVALVENGRTVAGGIFNPAASFLAIGGEGLGCTLNGVRVQADQRAWTRQPTVLASRTEVERGEWEHWFGGPIQVVPMGSVAYKLGRVACGLADATWTLSPKNEWDVAAGTLLVQEAGGVVCLPSGGKLRFNQPSTLLPGLIASSQESASVFTPENIVAGVLGDFAD